MARWCHAWRRVVKTRGAFISIFGMFNMRQTHSPRHDVRLRQAANLAMNREGLIRYATKRQTPRPPRYRSAMPAYENMLSDAEMWAVLAFIKSRWPVAMRAQQEQQNAPRR
jgi:mono/diheme cytochrome c family protein